MMISMDDPAHQQRRSLVNRGFTPKRVGDQEPKLREFCRTIINDVCERGECDFVWDVAARLPLMVIADMLGLSDMQEELLHWSEVLMCPTPANLFAAARMPSESSGTASCRSSPTAGGIRGTIS